MNLKRRRGNKSTGASGDASVATTPTAVTPSSAIATTSIAAAGITAAAVISGMAVTAEPTVTAAFAAGIGAARAVIARGSALPFRMLIAQHDPADDERPNHDDQRQ